MADAVDTFIERVCQSGLMDGEQVERLRGMSSAEDAAEWLISKNVLTCWQADELLAGNTRLMVGNYRLLEKVGEGAMGSVYRAKQPGIDRDVAIKIISRQVLEDNPSAAGRFRREMIASAALNHPNIVMGHTADQDGDACYLVMEYVEGRTLKQWIREHRRLPVKWSTEVIRQAANGLQHAYENGIVHRDIKPSNLLVVGADPHHRPLVKILDLGLVRLIGEEWHDRNLTRHDQVLGTPDYIAPEQAYNPHDVDIRADIYSLGCTLYRMLTGEVPFQGSTPMEKLMARAGADPPSVRELHPDVPESLDAVIRMMMAHDPAKRYQTPGEAAEALTPYSYAARPGQLPPPPPPPEEVSPPPQQEVEIPAPQRGSPLFAIVSGVLATLIVLGLALFFYREHEKLAPASPVQADPQPPDKTTGTPLP